MDIVTDSRDKPYNCARCGESFQRLDALRRHTRKSCPATSVSSTGTQRPMRASTACDSCHQKKLKCSGGQPCKSCFAKSISCTIERRVQRQRTCRSVSNLAHSPIDPIDLVHGKPSPPECDSNEVVGPSACLQGSAQICYGYQTENHTIFELSQQSHLLPILAVPHVEIASTNTLATSCQRSLNKPAIQEVSSCDINVDLETENDHTFSGNFDYFNVSTKSAVRSTLDAGLTALGVTGFPAKPQSAPGYGSRFRCIS